MKRFEENKKIYLSGPLLLSVTVLVVYSLTVHGHRYADHVK